MQRLGSNADVVLTQMAMEAIIRSAEAGAAIVGLEGTVVDDARGQYRTVTGVGEMQVGASMVSPDGGTSPDEGMLSRFRDSMGSGVMIVIDPYAGEFAFYLVEQEGERPARAVMSD